MAITRDQLTSLYQTELGRAPNFGVAGGADYWLNQSGLTNIEDVRSAVRQSQEYMQRQSGSNQQSDQSKIDDMLKSDNISLAGGNLTIDEGDFDTSQFSKESLESSLGRTLSPQEFSGYQSVYNQQLAMGRTPEFIMNSAAFGGGNQQQNQQQNQQNFPLTPAYTPEELNQAYIDVLGRPLGREGFNYWINDPDAVRSIRDISTLRATLAQSEEATNFATTGVPSTTYDPLDQFRMPYQPVQPADIQGDLDAIYRDLLGPTRGVGEEGLNTWTADYNTYRSAGDTHEQALAKIRQSVTDSEEATQYKQALEASTPFLQKFYTDYLGRQLGREGQEYWTSVYQKLIREGNSQSQALQMVEGMIANSEEAKIFANTGIAAEVEDPVGEMPYSGPTIQDTMIQRAMTPSLPVDPVTGQTVGEMQPAKIGAATSQQIIGSGVGQAPVAPTATAQTAGTTAQAMQPTVQTAAQVKAQDATPSVTQALQQVAPAQGSVSTQAQVEAAQMSPTATEVGTLGAAQIAQAQQVQQPQSRTLQSGEVVTAAANAQQATAFAEQVTAATANATQAATVQGQLADLMTQFDGGAVPAWAAGAMRTANATLAARGLGSSSIAGQAIVQAAMEAALPIASQDAQTIAQFELTNLSNRQQRAMLAAQQRAQFIGQEFDQEFQARVANAAKISDIANLNFNADQQVALENARLAQSVDLTNLQSRQALVMAEAAQISTLESANLNNRQQAAVQNAQSFLQMDLTNLSNQQQTDMFKAQSVVQSLLSDQAAENAARQFNAASENQVNQFFSNLQAQIGQFNATQTNAMEQFNTEEINAVEKFNKEMQAQRDQFNAQNQLIIEQSNAQWRRDISTADTAAQNLANQFNAEAILDISNTAYASLWQNFEDQMEYSWRSAESAEDRVNNIILQKLSNDATLSAANLRQDAADSAAIGKLITYSVFGSNWGGMFG